MRLVIFDIDGVLVDPAESFRRTVLEVVEQLTGKLTTAERVIEIKNEGGYNDDADVALRIARDHGFHQVTREQIEQLGERLFWGERQDGLILGERWLPEGGLLERLAARARLAIFTGRDRATAAFSLARFAPSVEFEPVMTSDQIANQKPAPDGLLKILEAAAGSDPLFVGDNIDDARAARAAGVPFVGVAEQGVHQRDQIVRLFAAEGALTVVESVNQIEALV